MDKLIILIPTAGKHTLLQRTLTGLSDCILPDNYLKTIVVENGNKFEAEIICNSYKESLKCEYLHYNESSKSKALNYAINSINDDCYIIFFDDDVRIDKNTIVAYQKAFTRHGKEYFYGGPFYVDYEVEPPLYYKHFMPLSAKGWHLFNDDNLDESTAFIGFNWALNKRLFDEVGGFNAYLGPGSKIGITVGDEHEIMSRLKRIGYLPQYVENAIVHHYVPKVKSSLTWTLTRKYKKGMSLGFLSQGRYTEFELYCKILKFIVLSVFNSIRFSRTKVLKNLVNTIQIAGILKGLSIKKNFR